MTGKVLQIDLHDAGRDGVYRVAPDDPARWPMTPPAPAFDFGASILAGTRVINVSWNASPRIRTRRSGPWLAALAAALREPGHISAPVYVLVLDHAEFCAPWRPMSTRCSASTWVALPATGTHAACRFFVFLVFPDSETLDAAIDA